MIDQPDQPLAVIAAHLVDVLADRWHVQECGTDLADTYALAAAFLTDRLQEARLSAEHPTGAAGSDPPMTAETRQALQALSEQWQAHANRVRPLEDAPMTPEKRARLAEWTHYTARLIELRAALQAEPSTLPATVDLEALELLVDKWVPSAAVNKAIRRQCVSEFFGCLDLAVIPTPSAPGGVRVAIAGVYMDRSIADFQRSCEVHIDEEQRKPNPDNALIALLCDSVRCSRELSAKSAAAIDSAPGGAALREFIERWEREVSGYVMGTMLPSPTGDMNRASADVVRRMLRELKPLATDRLPNGR